MADGVTFSDRKCRLYGVAVARLVSGWFVHPAQAEAVAVVERYADGEATAEELAKAGHAGELPGGILSLIMEDRRGSGGLTPEEFEEIGITADGDNARLLTSQGVNVATWAGSVVADLNRPPGTIGTITELDKDAIGVWANDRLLAAHGEVELDDDRAYLATFLAAEKEMKERLAALLREMIGEGGPPFPPVWRTPAVLAVAGDVYHHRDFASMPVLADALEDAGCTDAALLTHLRSPGPHIRGCWALDLVLGKK